MNIAWPFQWIDNEPGPKMLLEAIKLYGTKEVLIGRQNNPVILGWAKEIGIEDYTLDSIPWCGLFMGVIAHRAGKEVVEEPLWAANWLKFGIPVDEAMLGDVLVFKRPGGNHVALYIGESKDFYFVFGGNQGDAVSIVMMEKSRLRGIRRPKYNVQPANVRKILLTEHGDISTNES